MANKKSNIDLAIHKLSLLRSGSRNMRKVMGYLEKKEKGTGTMIYKATGMRQPEVSRLLAKLNRAGLVTTKTESVKVWYTLDSEKIAIIHSLAASIVII
jgi:DNA-binding transcriptional ArsR family regulator